MMEESKSHSSETEATEKVDLPPYPFGLFDWTEDQEKHWKYSEDKEDVPKRVSFKLWNVWLAWVDLRNDEKVIEIIAKTSEKDSDGFYLKQKIVSLLDRLGKVLGQTNITEEIVKCGA